MTPNKPKEMNVAKAKKLLKGDINMGEIRKWVIPVDDQFANVECWHVEYLKGFLHGIKLGLNDEAVKGLVETANRASGCCCAGGKSTLGANGLCDRCIALANYEARKKELGDA